MENKSMSITHVNGVYGKIEFKVGADDSLILCQNNASGTNNCIVLDAKVDAEKLAKALFKKKQELMSATKPKKAQAKPKLQQHTESAQQKNIGSSYVEQQKAEHPNAYDKWTNIEEKRLREYCLAGKSKMEMSNLLGRNLGAIVSRMRKLGLPDGVVMPVKENNINGANCASLSGDDVQGDEDNECKSEQQNVAVALATPIPFVPAREFTKIISFLEGGWGGYPMVKGCRHKFTFKMAVEMAEWGIYQKMVYGNLL